MKKLSEQLNELTQEAVDKAIEKRRLRGESIVISDDEGNVKVVPAGEIPDLQQANLPKLPRKDRAEDREAN